MRISKKNHLLLEQLEERIFMDANPILAGADVTSDAVDFHDIVSSLQNVAVVDSEQQDSTHTATPEEAAPSEAANSNDGSNNGGTVVEDDNSASIADSSADSQDASATTGGVESMTDPVGAGDSGADASPMVPADANSDQLPDSTDTAAGDSLSTTDDTAAATDGSETTAADYSADSMLEMNNAVDPLIGEDFTFTVSLDNNSGTTLYGPYIDLYFPTSGDDGDGDGVSFVGAKYLGEDVNAIVQTFDASGEIIHPYATAADGSALVIHGTAGDTYVTLEMPFGSFTNDQPAADVEITAHISANRAVDSSSDGDVNDEDFDIKVYSGYRFGETAVDDPDTDPPIGPTLVDTQTFRPEVLRFNKEYLGPEQETATGPNYVQQYQITIDIANGQTISNLEIIEHLPDEIYYLGNSTVSVNGAATGFTVISPNTTGNGDGIFADGVLTIVLDNPITGSLVKNDVVVTFDFYVPRYYADGTTPILDPYTGDDAIGVTEDRQIVNDVQVGGDWIPTDLDDASVHFVVDAEVDSEGNFSLTPSNDEEIAGEAIAIQKAVGLVSGGDTGISGKYNPGDVVQYSLTFQLSDYFSLGDIVIDDLLPDGLQFYSSTDPGVSDYLTYNVVYVPTFTIQDDTGNWSGNWTAGSNLTYTVSADGQNNLALSFDVSAVSGGGILQGDMYDGIFDGTAAQGTITYFAFVKNEYLSTGPGDSSGLGDTSIDQGDIFSNSVDIEGQIYGDDGSGGFTSTGYDRDQDDSGASFAIAVGSVQKSIYAINGHTNYSAYVDSDGVHVQPGYTVTYRLTYTMPTSEFEDFQLDDYLPLPVFNAGEVTAYSTALTLYQESDAAPVAGQWHLLTSDSFMEAYPGENITLSTYTLNGENRVSFTFDDNHDIAPQQTIIDFVFTVTVTDDPFADGLYLTNQVRATEDGTTLVASDSDAIIEIVLDEPVLDITKGVVATNNSNGIFSPVGPTNDSNLDQVDAGDTVTYQVLVENTGHAPAYDIILNDILPVGYTVSDISNFTITDGNGAILAYTGGIASYFNTTGIEVTGYDKDGDGAADDGDGLGVVDGDVGENQIKITYDLTLRDDVGPDQALNNTAEVISFAGTEGGALHSSVTDDATVSITDIVVDKTVSPGTGTIGDEVQYTLTITIPEGTAHDFTLQDNVVAGLKITGIDSITVDDATGVTVANGTVGGGGVITMNSGISILTTSETNADQDLLTIAFGDIVSVSNSGAKTFTITYTALIRDLNGNDRGDSLANDVTLSWKDATNTTQTATDTTSITVIEPRIVTDKQIDGANATLAGVEAGDTITYSFRLTNNGNATAFETTALDTLTQGVSFDSGSLQVTYHDTSSATNTDITLFSQATDSGTGTVSFGSTDDDSWDIGAGDYIQVSYTVTVLSSAIVGDHHVNTVDADWTSLDGSHSGIERVYDDRPGRLMDGAQDTDTATFEMGLVLDKTNDQADGEATIGDVITYTIAIDPPQGQLNNFTIQDALPAGMSFVSGSDTVTSSFTDPDPAVSVDTSSGSAVLQWSFGSFIVDSDASITISYQARVDNVAGNTDGASEANTVTASFTNSAGTLNTVTDTSTFDIVEPVIETTKVVAGTVDGDTAQVQVGNVIEYQITLTNIGNASAYEVTAEDQLADGVIYVDGLYQGLMYTPTAIIGGVDAGITITESGGVLSMTSATDGWDIGEGQSVTITYYALVGPSYFNSTSGNNTTNTVDADWSNQNGTNPDERIYDDGVSQPVWTVDTAQDMDTAVFAVDYSGSLGDLVFYDADNSGNHSAGDVGIKGVEVVLSADFDGDNIADFTKTTTTAADGSYIFTGLPAFSEYVITVDPSGATLPQGLHATYDLDGSNDSVSAVTLAVGQNRVDVDFGYTGSGSIGDTIWYDSNRNGLEDEANMGIVGAEVTLRGDLDGDGVYEYTATGITGNTGHYQFSNLPFVHYVVEVTSLPGGLTEQTGDPDAVLDSRHELTLTSAAPDPGNVDFGYIGAGSIGDTVWRNNDGDAFFDSNEVGLANVTVTLRGDLNGDGTLETLTSITDGNGRYQFAGLGAGNYTLSIDPSTLPDGLTASDANYDLDGTFDNTTSVQLGGGQNLLTADFGYLDLSSVTPGQIGDFIWLDLNNDGIQDGGSEIGLQGVTVHLLDGGGAIIDTIVTDSTGYYLFSGLSAGMYTVQVDATSLPGNVTPTYDLDGGSDNEASVTLTASSSAYNLDFGYRGNGQIGDTVWLDLDQNSTPDIGAGDFGLANVDITLQIDLDGDGHTDATLTTITDSSGQYLFDNLPYGTYTILIDGADLPNGIISSVDPDGGSVNQAAVILDSAGPSNLNLDFGYIGRGGIGDQVWQNTNGNSVVDGVESGLSGVGLELRGDFNHDGTVDVTEVLTTTTDSSGYYQFTDLPAGVYTVEVVSGVTGGFNPNYDLDGGLDGSATVVLGSGQALSTVDFGYSNKGSIGDAIWLDIDGDGVQDGGNEIGLGNVTVELHHSDGTIVTTVTDSTGHYYFGNLNNGAYSVVVDTSTLPSGMYQTYDYDIAHGGILDNSVAVTLAAGSNIRDDLDFGYRGQGVIGDTVWLDLDGNNTPNVGGGDFGLAQVDVTLSIDFDGDFSPDATMTAITDNQGRYLFQGLPYGQYTVSVDTSGLPGGVSQIADPDAGMDSHSSLALTAMNQTRMDQDFGYRGTGSIGQTVWNNLDGDNTVDGGESGIPGASVILAADFNHDGIISVSEHISVSTDAFGQYVFSGLPEGSYTVSVDSSTLPAGMSGNYDLDGILDNSTMVTLSVVNMSNTTANFGYETIGSIGDTVWYDYDGDGIQDSNEIGLSGVTVILTDSSNNTTITSTDGNGHYSFTNLGADTYTVAIDTTTLPAAGLVPTSDLDGLMTLNTTTVILGAGANNLNVDFGYTGTGSIGDTLWNDQNGNGVRDGGEAGFSGVEVSIGIDLDGNGTVDFSAITTTDRNGHYLFQHLPAGSHVVGVNTSTLPNNAILNFDPDGGLNNTAIVHLGPGETVDTVDFGYRFPEQAVVTEPPALLSSQTPDPLVVDAFIMHRQFSENVDQKFWVIRPDDLYVVQPVPIHPVYTGMAEPGTTLTLTLYDAMGNKIGFQTVMADTAGNWLASFPAAILYDIPHHMVIDADSSPYNHSSPGLFNLRTYFQPSFSNMMFAHGQLDVENIFAYLPSTIMASMHASNLQLEPLGWDDFNGYEFYAPSINPANLGR